ncbi:MAG: NADH:flavin oxidoreductase/NADH oxidase [Cyanobacteria bacterium REEB65]|nr:NADH:flavin oxidoreductase/NADH oxidase [Cyanobacteria bacterium REEB65]
MPAPPPLFEPIKLRGISLRNRIAVSPMCQYSSTDGLANDWHLVHLGSMAIGGAALVMVEATAVEAAGRISPQDMGLWSDAHIEPLSRIARFIKQQGAVPGLQLAHAGRKASTPRPWDRHLERPLSLSDGGWSPIYGPSAIAFDETSQVPAVLDRAGIERIVDSFAQAARRAERAGFDLLEIHAAHGYLLHEFLSPIANQRTDDFGGSFDNRIRLLLAVVDAIRDSWPADLPVFVRISATDWIPGGWDVQESIELAKRLQERGVDLVDVSSGGIGPAAQIPVAPGYQVPFAERIRTQAAIATAAVGLITTPDQANEILRTGKADLVMLARELLRDPHWPLRAARDLGYDISWPPAYERAKVGPPIPR